VNIISTISFAEHYEMDILLAKLHTEDAGICEWVMCENTYTHTGEYKGNHLVELLDQDARFDQFRHKIKVISNDIRPTHRPTNETGWFNMIATPQRDSGIPYILERYSDDGAWLVPSDLDVIFDFTGSNRTDLIYDMFGKVPSDERILFSTVRYIYDFDNYGYCQYYNHCLPLELVRKIRSIHIVMPENKTHRVLDPTKGEFAVFEYSFCFKTNHMVRKLEIYGHHDYTRDDLELALKCNKQIMRASMGKHDPSPERWYETVALDETNSLPYVLHNINALKTHAVDQSYRENRRVYFPEYFS